MAKFWACVLRKRILVGEVEPSRLASEAMIWSDPGTAVKLQVEGSSATQFQPSASLLLKSSLKIVPVVKSNAVDEETGAVVAAVVGASVAAGTVSVG